MEFLTKIEDLINKLIIRFGELMLQLFRKLTPPKVMSVLRRFGDFLFYWIKNFKALPANLKSWCLAFVARTRTRLMAIDYKGRAIEGYKKLESFYKAQSAKGSGKFKSLFMTPYLLVASWLKGLTPVQSVALITLTAASFLSAVQIVSSGQRLIGQAETAVRSPASAEEELQYDRPDYYKKDQRHVLVASVRLPVYVAKVNELRSVDIDFNVTVSNRQAKKFLEQYEFQLRDYLILHIEPLVASFPLEEEGKEVLLRKLWSEVDNFLRERNVEGHVEEVKITYILAN